VTRALPKEMLRASLAQAFHANLNIGTFPEIVMMPVKRAFLPLSIIGAGGWALPNWVQGYERHWAEQWRLADESGDAAAAKAMATNAKAEARLSRFIKSPLVFCGHRVLSYSPRALAS
jgi:hypothetical protein